MAKSSADMYKKHLERAKTLNDATSATNWTGTSAAEYPTRGGERLKDLLLRKKRKRTHRTSTEVGRHELWSNAQCRTCFEDIECTNFHELTEHIDPVKSLTDLLGDIAKIDVKSEIERNLPQKMCENCFQSLRNAYSFIVQAELVQEYLLSSLCAKDVESQAEDNFESNPTDAVSILPVVEPTNAIQMKVEMVEENICRIPTDISSNSTQIKREVVEENVCEMTVDISPNNSIELKIEENDENMIDYYNKPSTSNGYNFIREHRSTILDGKEHIDEDETLINVPGFLLDEGTEFEDKGFEGCANNVKRSVNMDFNKTLTMVEGQPLTKRDLEDFKADLSGYLQNMNENIMQEHKNTQKLLKRLLEERKSSKPIKSTDILKVKAILPKEPYTTVEHFMDFEARIQASESMFNDLVIELQAIVCGNSIRFIKLVWRKVMSDDVARQFCWKGTLNKGAIRALSMTVALKQAYNEKFSNANDEDFERTNKSFFHQANNRLAKKKQYEKAKENIANAN